jgi:hypothetical protein
MFSAFPFLHTEPEGNPADDVGMLLIDRLLTNVVHTLSVVILFPTTKEQLQVAKLLLPARTPE